MGCLLPTSMNGRGAHLLLDRLVHKAGAWCRNNGTGFCINDMSPPFWFWLRFKTRIWFRSFHFSHQRLPWAVVNSVMPRALMEVAPLLGIFLCIFGVLIFLWLGLVVLILTIFSLSFVLWVGAAPSWLLICGVTRPKLSCLLFELLLDFDGMSVGRAQRQDVQKFHFGPDVSIQSTAILEH
jgi:hypothetical protein